jgi:hypothetical protein
VRRWLAWKLDVFPVYFGTGDGPSSLLRWPLKLALRLRPARRRGAARPAGDNGHAPSISAARLVWALVLTAEKRSKMRAVVKARNRGMIVVCDRYPQAQVHGFNDGPLLAAWLESPSALRRRIARWELETYAQLARTAPDLVVKLDVTPETGMQRSPDSAPGEVERKREAVRVIDYGPACRTVEIDTLRPLPEVLLAVKQAVWAEL